MSQKRQVRIYIEDDGTFDSLKGGTALTDTQLASMIMNAAVKAIAENGGKASLPLQFHIGDFDGLRAHVPKRKAA